MPSINENEKRIGCRTIECVVLLVAVLGFRVADASERPNIVILYADDMGVADVSYGEKSAKIQTPHIDSLARSGMAFSDGHSSSGICTPSRFALLTGQHHWRRFHGIVGPFGGSVFERDDFTYDEANDRYICPAGKDLKRYRVAGRRAKAEGNVPKDGTYRYRALKSDCDACALKPKCCPKLPVRKVPRSIYETSRDVARNLRGTADYEFMRHERKKVEMSFAHLKTIIKLDRFRLRGPTGANDEFLLAATAQNLRKMAKLYMNGHKMSTA